MDAHTHDGAAAGCFGERVRAEALGEKSSEASTEPDLSSAYRPGISRKLPHLVK
jgi:hypothetical protein